MPDLPQHHDGSLLGRWPWLRELAVAVAATFIGGKLGHFPPWGYVTLGCACGLALLLYIGYGLRRDVRAVQQDNALLKGAIIAEQKRRSAEFGAVVGILKKHAAGQAQTDALLRVLACIGYPWWLIDYISKAQTSGWVVTGSSDGVKFRTPKDWEGARSYRVPLPLPEGDALKLAERQLRELIGDTEAVKIDPAMFADVMSLFNAVPLDKPLPDGVAVRRSEAA